MWISESDLFTGQEDVNFRELADSDESVKITYEVDDDKRKKPYVSPFLDVEVKYFEDKNIYNLTSERQEIKALSYNPTRGIAELIKYAREQYHYTKYKYAIQRDGSGDIQGITVLRDDDTKLFTIGETIDDTTEEGEFSHDFWEALYKTERSSSRQIERINNSSISVEGFRIPVKEQLSEFEQEAIVHINKYLIKYYKSNYVLRDDPELHQFISSAAVYTGHEPHCSEVLVYSSRYEDN